MPRGKRSRGTRRPGLKVVTRKGSASFYVRGTVAGKQVFESLKTDDRKIAEEARIKLEGEMLRHSIHGTKPKVMFPEAAESYLDHAPRSQATRLVVVKLSGHFVGKACSEINQSAIDSAARILCRPGSKPATVLRQVTAPVKAVLTHAAFRGWCEMPRFQSVKAAGRRTDWFTPAEAEAVIAAAADHLQPLITFLFCTGCRLGEAIDLEWRDIDLRYGRVVFRGTKNGDDRAFDLPPLAIIALANLPGERAGRVFLHPAGKAMVPYRRTEDGRAGGGGGQIKRGWASALKNAGIVDRQLTPHHCRHSWSTWFFALHKDILKLRDAGGWRSIVMVERYARTPPDGLGADAGRFWGLAASSAISRIA